mgnify:CR=1 FL=1
MGEPLVVPCERTARAERGLATTDKQRYKAKNKDRNHIVTAGQTPKDDG